MSFAADTQSGPTKSSLSIGSGGMREGCRACARRLATTLSSLSLVAKDTAPQALPELWWGIEKAGPKPLPDRLLQDRLKSEIAETNDCVRSAVRILHLLVLSALFSTMAVAQDEAAPAEKPERRPVPPVITSMQTPVKVHASHVLAEGTPVALRLVTGIKAKEAEVGDVAEFVLEHDLQHGETLLAKEGTAVQAVVIEASKAKWFSRGSKLGIDIQGLRLLNGQTLPLRGTPEYHGGVGPAAQIGGGLIAEAAKPSSGKASPLVPGVGPGLCVLCEMVLVPASAVTLVAPGTNHNVQANTLATAYVDGNMPLNIESFRAFQPHSGGATAKLRVVRGHYGAWYGRDFYCNGVPLAHFPANRKLELELQPGWYRFAINSKKEPVELYLQSGSETRLITDYERVYVVNDPGKGERLSDSGKGSFAPDRSVNSHSLNPFSKKKSEREYLEDAKPVDAADRYPTECHPLPVEASENPNPDKLQRK